MERNLIHLQEVRKKLGLTRGQLCYYMKVLNIRSTKDIGNRNRRYISEADCNTILTRITTYIKSGRPRGDKNEKKS